MIAEQESVFEWHLFGNVVKTSTDLEWFVKILSLEWFVKIRSNSLADFNIEAESDVREADSGREQIFWRKRTSWMSVGSETFLKMGKMTGKMELEMRCKILEKLCKWPDVPFEKVIGRS